MERVDLSTPIRNAVAQRKVVDTKATLLSLFDTLIEEERDSKKQGELARLRAQVAIKLR